MSETNKHNEEPPAAKPTAVRMGLWALLFAVMMLLMTIVTIVAVAMPYNRSLEEADAVRRRGLIGDRSEKAKAQLHSYGWVNEKEKKAHIPIDVAMEKYLETKPGVPAELPEAATKKIKNEKEVSAVGYCPVTPEWSDAMIDKDKELKKNK